MPQGLVQDDLKCETNRGDYRQFNPLKTEEVWWPKYHLYLQPLNAYEIVYLMSLWAQGIARRIKFQWWEPDVLRSLVKSIEAEAAKANGRYPSLPDASSQAFKEWLRSTSGRRPVNEIARKSSMHDKRPREVSSRNEGRWGERAWTLDDMWRRHMLSSMREKARKIVLRCMRKFDIQIRLPLNSNNFTDNK